jgi:hypothetical protein
VINKNRAISKDKTKESGKLEEDLNKSLINNMKGNNGESATEIIENLQ